jgi:hypothetical protein
VWSLYAAWVADAHNKRIQNQMSRSKTVIAGSAATGHGVIRQFLLAVIIAG